MLEGQVGAYHIADSHDNLLNQDPGTWGEGDCELTASSLSIILCRSSATPNVDDSNNCFPQSDFRSAAPHVRSLTGTLHNRRTYSNRSN
jgi:hypothetical protein